MPQVVRVAPLAELETSRRRTPSQRQLVKQEYRSLVGQVENGQFLELRLSEGELEKYQTVKERLHAAARDLGKAVQIRRRGALVRVQLKQPLATLPRRAEDAGTVAEPEDDIFLPDIPEPEQNAPAAPPKRRGRPPRKQ